MRLFMCFIWQLYLKVLALKPCNLPCYFLIDLRKRIDFLERGKEENSLEIDWKMTENRWRKMKDTEIY